MKPPSRQLYVENHRAHEVMLGCQQSIQGNSGIIGASIWLAIAANNFGKWSAIWQNDQWPAVTFSSGTGAVLHFIYSLQPIHCAFSIFCQDLPYFLAFCNNPSSQRMRSLTPSTIAQEQPHPHQLPDHLYSIADANFHCQCLENF